MVRAVGSCGGWTVIEVSCHGLVRSCVEEVARVEQNTAWVLELQFPWVIWGQRRERRSGEVVM